MKIQAKEILIVLLGLIGTLILKLSSGNNFINLKVSSIQDIIITTVVLVIAIIYVIYRRMAEIEEDIDKVKNMCNDLSEKLKTQEKLTKLEARLIYLEKNQNGKKK